MRSKRDIGLLSEIFLKDTLISIAHSMGMVRLDWADDLRMSLGPEWLKQCSDQFDLHFFDETHSP